MDRTDREATGRGRQIACPGEGRALPRARAVVQHPDPEGQRRALVQAALWFLREQWPGVRSRSVLGADRGFPGPGRIRAWRDAGWRFVLRVARRWTIAPSEEPGEWAAAPDGAGWVGPRPRRLAGVGLGRRGKGADAWRAADLVLAHGPGRAEPWDRATRERAAARAVAIDRERRRIEGECRDIKGPFGLDPLAHGQHRERVARFLALVAVDEGRWALRWVRHQWRPWRHSFTQYGPWSGIRRTRECIQRQIRSAARPALARL